MSEVRVPQTAGELVSRAIAFINQCEDPAALRRMADNARAKGQVDVQRLAERNSIQCRRRHGRGL